MHFQVCLNQYLDTLPLRNATCVGEGSMPEIKENTEREIPNTRLHAPAVLRWVFALISRLVPPLATRLAAYLWCLPKRGLIKSEERVILAEAHSSRLNTGMGQLAVWSWGEGPVVLLLHGWGSRASRLVEFVNPLVGKGYRVVAFDAPAHGDSEGRTTTGPYIARSLEVVASHVGEVKSVIAHSMGCWVTALALRDGLKLERAVFIGPPVDMDYYSRMFALQTGFTEKVQRMAERRLEEETGVPWSRLDPETLFGGYDIPLLIVHDREDPVTPLAQAEILHDVWSGSELFVTTGLGHRLTVRDPNVVARAVEFVTGQGPI